MMSLTKISVNEDHTAEDLVIGDLMPMMMTEDPVSEQVVIGVPNPETMTISIDLTMKRDRMVEKGMTYVLRGLETNTDLGKRIKIEMK